MGRGAFVNEECLFRDTPVQFSTVADEDCTVWAISRQSMKDLEAHDPHLAAAILRNILRVSAVVRDRLEREVSAIESYNAHSEFGIGGTQQSMTATTSSKGLGTKMLAQIRDMDQEDHDIVNKEDGSLMQVTGAGTHHSHHFRHMGGVLNAVGPSGQANYDSPPNSPRVAASRGRRGSRAGRTFAAMDWRAVRPHLSAAQRQDAIDCFLFHSVLQEIHEDEAGSGGVGPIDVEAVSRADPKTLEALAHPDILPELILAGAPPDIVQAVANYKDKVVAKKKQAAAAAAHLPEKGGAEKTHFTDDALFTSSSAGAASAAAAMMMLGRRRSGTLDTLATLRRPKTIRELEDYAEKEAEEIAKMEIAAQYLSGGAGQLSPPSLQQNHNQQRPAQKTKTTMSPKRSNIKLGSDHRRISLDELQRAVMDLGLFPTAAEVRAMHATLGPHGHTRAESKAFEDGADLDEFLEMVTVLSLKRVSKENIVRLHTLFVAHADKETGTKLSRKGLSDLMVTLNHPEDEVELEFLMKEWDLDAVGYLDFDAFVSIVSHVLKSEELDELVERDFLHLCGQDVGSDTSTIMSSPEKIAVTAADVVRTARRLGVMVDQDLAEEMIFDADESGTGKLSLDSLIACIEAVGIDEEIVDAGGGGDDDGADAARTSPPITRSILADVSGAKGDLETSSPPRLSLSDSVASRPSAASSPASAASLASPRVGLGSENGTGSSGLGSLRDAGRVGSGTKEGPPSTASLEGRTSPKMTMRTAVRRVMSSRKSLAERRQQRATLSIVTATGETAGTAPVFISPVRQSASKSGGGGSS